MIIKISITNSKVLYMYIKQSQCFLVVLGVFTGALQRTYSESTVRSGFRYCADFMCSSTSLGVTQTICWPFQYLTMFRDCSVPMMSSCVKLVSELHDMGGRKKDQLCVCTASTCSVHLSAEILTTVLYRDYAHPYCMLQSSYRWDGLNFENSSFPSKLSPPRCLPRNYAHS